MAMLSGKYISIPKMNKYYTDGYTILKNPSDIGGGYTIFKNDTLLLTKEILSPHFTNNEGELLGIYNTLIIANNKDIVSTDSHVSISWINGKIKKKSARHDLDYMKIMCKELIKRKNIKLIWEEREKNLAGIYNEEHKLE